MLERFFPDRRKKKPQINSFGTVPFSRRLVEYRGALPGTRAVKVRIEHWLFLERVPFAARAVLAKELGNRGNPPTHIIYCLFRLPRDKAEARCLFCIHLDISEIRSSDYQNWIAARTTKDLAQSLIDCKQLSFLIRCQSHKEFHFCVPALELDDYWLSEAGKFYRFYLRRVRSLDVGDRL